ncbi:MAG: hypothetical protein EA397_02550 [Deltaproteobacteria bacterium]|nr:MAG: hypothetical protein EA397_02550 [Deltaproteobacteria bacterium]
MVDLSSWIGTYKVHIPSGFFFQVEAIHEGPDGQVLSLNNRFRHLMLPVQSMDDLRDPADAEEASRQIERMKALAPYTGEHRRLAVRLALEGTLDQQLASIGTMLDWWSTVPPHEERAEQLDTDPDWSAATSSLLRLGISRFAEWGHALGLSLASLELMEHFTKVRAQGSRSEVVPAPDPPPQPDALCDLPQEDGSGILGEITLDGPLVVGDALWVNEPVDDVKVPVSRSLWTVAAVAVPDPEYPDTMVNGRIVAGVLVSWVLLVRGPAARVELAEWPRSWVDRIRGWLGSKPTATLTVRVDDREPLPLERVGAARVESGLLAVVGCPPDTAERSIFFAPDAALALWPWGVHFRTGGDGWFDVYTATAEGEVQVVACRF